METRRLMNDALPRSLYYAQFALYVGAIYPIVQAILTGTFAPPLLLLSFFNVLAAYGISNEAKWGYWFGLIVSSVTIVHVLYDFVRNPGTWWHMDVWVLAALPICVIVWLTHPDSRDFERIWFS